jgi:LysM repeat protein
MCWYFAMMCLVKSLMIIRLVFAGALAALAVGCANNNQQTDSMPTPAVGDTAAYGDQTTALPVAGEHSGKSYTVVSGDSLWKIARNHGTTVEKLKTANNLTGEMIHPGQVLVLP